MKRIFTASLFLFFAFSGSSLFAQVSKGNWIVGGSGSLDFSSNKAGGVGAYGEYKIRKIGLSPYAGYFPINQLAIGLKTSFEKNEVVNNGNYSDSKSLEAGPFARYYFMPSGNKINLLAEGAYQYGYYWNQGEFKARTFSFSAGPVFFVNRNVGVELLMGYYNKKEVNRPVETFDLKTNGFRMSLGVQVHLGKAKK